MSDFLTRLAERQLTAVPAVAPRVPPRFAPVAPVLPDAAPPVSTLADVPPGEARKTTERVVVRVENQSQADVSVTPVAATEGPVAVPAHESPQLVPVQAVTTRSGVYHVADDHATATEPQSSKGLVPVSPGETAPGPAALDIPDTLRRLVPEESRTAPAHMDRSVMPQPLVPRVHEPASRATQPSMPDPQPVMPPAPSPITVTIGRIEVRAITPPPRRERTTVDRHTALSLKEYLDRRRGGGR